MCLNNLLYTIHIMHKTIIPILHDIKKYLEIKKLDYFEIRYENHDRRVINVENLDTKDLLENNNQGIGIRVLVDKKVGFLSLNNFEEYRSKIDRLIENTKKTNKKTEMNNFSKIKDKDIVKHKDFNEVDNSTKIKELIKVNKELLSKEDNIKILNSDIIKQEITTEKYFLTKEAEIYQKRPYSIIFSLMTAKKDNKIESNLTRIGNLGGLEKYSVQDIEKLLLSNKNKLKELFESKACPAIKSDIILHPNVADLLAHEAIGHACEADFLLDNTTVLKKGLKISINKEVNVTDNPEIREFGYFKYDDEGIKARKTELIKKGVVNDFMTNIESATKLKTKSNGSARAENYNQFPVVRMSNTYFEEGKHKIEDMLKNFNGYLLSGFSGGQVETNVGTFMFGIKQAYKYKNGEIAEKYKQASISGNILTYLNNITEISNKKDKFEIGFCGKSGQTAFVGGAGPYIKVKDAIIGGTKHE